MVNLLKQKSTRCDSKGVPFNDLYVVWSHDNKTYAVRVKPSFSKDYRFLLSVAREVPQGEPLEKYM